MSPKPSLLGLDRPGLEAVMEEFGQPRYRAGQVLDWLYAKRAPEFRAMSNLPSALRSQLEERFVLSPLRSDGDVHSGDTTRKYLFRLHDGRYVESVLIPASPARYGERSSRHTLCVSSQVGCAYGCKFCASGLDGFSRNLDAAEIVGQLLAVEAASGKRVNNLVFMGMGEPLANLANLSRAITILNASWGVGIGARNITVSTSGLAPQIRALADLPLQIRLAISLHGASDEVRERIMPVNRKYPLDVLFDAVRYYNARKKQKVTFEYILIDGVNASTEQAEQLAKRASSLNAKVNLIPYNTVEGLPWSRPDEPGQEAFLDILVRRGVQATLRREKGHDIAAACGQLRLRKEREAGALGACRT